VNKVKRALVNIDNKYAAKELKKFLEGFDPKDTVIHIHTYCKSSSSSVFPVIEKAGFKYVVTLHDYFLICGNGALYDYQKEEVCKKKPGSFSCMMCNCDKRSYKDKIFRDFRQKKIYKRTKNIKYLISIAENNEKLIKAELPDADYTRIYNPLKNDVVVEDYTKNNLFLFVGRVDKEKNPEMFCKAITKLGLKGVVIGAGGQLDYLKEKYPNIEFTGWLQKEEILEYKMHAKCLIFSTKWYEGMPLSVVEFLLSRIPVITSSVSNSTELNLKRDLIFKSENLESLVKVIERFNSRTDKEYFDENFDYDDICNKFDEKKNYKKLTDLYQRMLEE